jgi:hypothetical protein
MALITIYSFSFIKGRLNRLRRQDKKRRRVKREREDKAHVDKLIWRITFTYQSVMNFFFLPNSH